MASRLASQPSPYLQQHADNPVDWWPWSEAAFEEAKRRDVPVFLSIGYATCHWCHVMAHESFEDAEVARAMNEAFVCIKVDREERPDVDELYMAACQALTGAGGWPLTVLLDHDKRPWFAGTYFPRQSMANRIGMMDLVPAIEKAWQAKREDIHRQAEHLAQHIRSQRPRSGDAPDAGLVQAGTDAVAAAYDERHGGFSRQPKFPSLHIVRFLLRRHMDGDERAGPMAHHTLQAMARAGIRDMVGGGFHRYSTDARWHLPHFEKMLYDQAMALWTYAEAHRLDPQPIYERVLRDTAAYLERDMRHESGAFFAAEDADSEGEEGLFYTWPWQELVDLAGEDLARSLGAAPEGNHHDEATRQPIERNILYAADPGRLGVDLVAGWQDTQKRLLEHRAKRVRPLRDEKVMADWNGLAIAGLASASIALQDDRLASLAAQAADAVLGNMRDGSLRHTWIHGKLGESSFAEDHASMARGLLLLYEATWDPRWLAEAGELLEALEGFAAQGGAYHRSAREELFARPVESYDGAIPSANTIAAEAWLHHARLTGSTRSAQRAEGLLEAFGGSMREHPRALVGMLGVAADLLAPWCDVVVEAPEDSELLAAARRLRAPRVHVLRHDRRLESIVEFLPAAAGEVAYLCTGDACGPPIHDAADLEAAVGQALANRP